MQWNQDLRSEPEVMMLSTQMAVQMGVDFRLVLRDGRRRTGKRLTAAVTVLKGDECEIGSRHKPESSYLSA